MTDPAEVIKFLTAGRARVTLVSLKTGKRYTFKISASKDGEMFFVKTLVGSDNETDYEYIGFMKEQQGWRLIAGRKGNPNMPQFKAFDWMLAHLSLGNIPAELEIWHEGRCGRCGRALTDPASIAAGFGPECVNHV